MANRETRFQNEKLLPGLRSQGFKAECVSDGFIGGRPDFRMGRKDLGQLDVELKFMDAVNGVVDTGLSKLQQIEIREMNKHGMPAVALSYLDNRDEFVIHFDRELDLDSIDLYLLPRVPGPSVIDGQKLMELAFYFLEEIGLG